MERSAEMVVALLGVLKAGGAYVPVEVDEGPARLRQMLREAEVAVVLTQQRRRATADAATGEATSGTGSGATRRPRILCLDSEWETVAGQGRENLPQTADPNNLAYVIYTSGSSGRPKGALVTHEGLVNYLKWAVTAYELTAASRSLLHSALSFDLTVTSLYAPLMVGGCVELAAAGGGASGLVAALRDEGKSYGLVKLTPAHLEVLRQELGGRVGAKVGALVVGGEALYGESVGWWQEQAAELRVYNEYGPTETVVGCSVEEVARGSRGAVGIGRAIANSWLYVLDERLRVVPVGVRGELYIGGAGVGRGYLGSPELTAERFVPDGERGAAGSRLYRTGDVCSWGSEGRLQYLGRVDQQVKVRGYRVELGEVETVLLEEASVSEAVVVGMARTQAGVEPGSESGPRELRLVGYVVPAAGVPVALEQLRRRLREQLPEYMIPELVVLGALPLTANGKVDRRALPAPEQVRSAALGVTSRSTI
jgi:amino acid adenylation domain-containing protein